MLEGWEHLRRIVHRDQERHPGTEFIYMLQGRIEYRHGLHTYVLAPGDSLTFRGSVPHGPEKLIELPIKFLAVIVYGGPGEP